MARLATRFFEKNFTMHQVLITNFRTMGICLPLRKSFQTLITIPPFSSFHVFVFRSNTSLITATKEEASQIRSHNLPDGCSRSPTRPPILIAARSDCWREGRSEMLDLVGTLDIQHKQLMSLQIRCSSDRRTTTERGAFRN